jgi:hypothetical protein
MLVRRLKAAAASLANVGGEAWGSLTVEAAARSRPLGWAGGGGTPAPACSGRVVAAAQRTLRSGGGAATASASRAAA